MVKLLLTNEKIDINIPNKIIRYTFYSKDPGYETIEKKEIW